MSTPTALRLDGELTIYRAQELRQTLLDALDQPGDLRLDLEGVSELDSSAVQLLLAARQDALAAGKRFAISVASGPVREVLGLMGLAGLLHPPLETTGALQ